MDNHDLVPERALREDSPSGDVTTSSVVAETACVLHRLSMTDFRRMESNEPDLAASLHRVFATFLARRLDDTLHTIQALLD